MLRSTVLACVAAAATAFAPGAVLPSSSGLRLAGQQGPVCFLAEGAAKSEPLTVLNGRGDKRSVKGKRFAKSHGKCRPKKGNREDNVLPAPYDSKWGQPTCEPAPSN